MTATRIAASSESSAAQWAASLRPPSRMKSVASGTRANSELRNSELLTGSSTCLYIALPPPRGLPRNYPLTRDSCNSRSPRSSGPAAWSKASVRRARRAVAGMRLVARRGAPVPQQVVDRGGRGRTVGLHEQLDRVQRAGADLDLLGRVVHEA